MLSRARLARTVGSAITHRRSIMTMDSSRPTRSSPRKGAAEAQALSSTSASKRAAASPLKDGRAAKALRSIDDELDLADDSDFDADALHEAAKAAEEEDARTQKTQAAAKSKADSTPSQDKAQGSQASQLQSVAHGDVEVETQTMEREWFDRLKEEMDKDYFRQLRQFLQGEAKAGKTIYPPASLVHSWSRLTPLNQVKVVVVGQDPYHGPGQACGHSFSVPKGVKVPGSLQNMYKELKQEYGDAFTAPRHGCLDGWAKQGVLLLNACLTVSAGQAGSHHNKGWEPFTQQILRIIAKDAARAPKAAPSAQKGSLVSMFNKQQGNDKAASSKKEDDRKGDEKKEGFSRGVVFLAWGLPAAKTLAAAGITEQSPNILLLKSAHPSPLSAHRGFLGNGHFKRANQWLEEDAHYGPNGGIKWGNL